jgi:DNA-binding XRE family transcriptional regulator
MGNRAIVLSRICLFASNHIVEFKDVSYFTSGVLRRTYPKPFPALPQSLTRDSPNVCQHSVGQFPIQRTPEILIPGSVPARASNAFSQGHTVRRRNWNRSIIKVQQFGHGQTAGQTPVPTQPALEVESAGGCAGQRSWRHFRVEDHGRRTPVKHLIAEYPVSNSIASKKSPMLRNMAKPQHKQRYQKLPGMLREMREAAALTQRDLAKKLKMSHVAVHLSEVGDRRIDVTEFIDWCIACGVAPLDAMAKLLKM